MVTTSPSLNDGAEFVGSEPVTDTTSITAGPKFPRSTDAWSGCSGAHCGGLFRRLEVLEKETWRKSGRGWTAVVGLAMVMTNWLREDHCPV
eukprot:3938521-Rhodomonas_salina.5